jgi:hypothetical protein
MPEPAGPAERWDVTWEASRRETLESTLAATPAQRLAWLEEALELALRAGAIRVKQDPADTSGTPYSR